MGFATLETMSGGPPGADLTYLLPEAQSAISFVMPLNMDLIRPYLAKEYPDIRGIHEKDNIQTNVRVGRLSRDLRDYLRENGFKAEGQEINERAAIEVRKREFRVYTGSFEDYQSTKTYDLVVFSNVLEHSLQPKKMLAHVARILKTGGQLWINCPNFDSWQRSFFGKYWINWHVPFHIVHFTRDALARIL